MNVRAGASVYINTRSCFYYSNYMVFTYYAARMLFFCFWVLKRKVAEKKIGGFASKIIFTWAIRKDQKN